MSLSLGVHSFPAQQGEKQAVAPQKKLVLDWLAQRDIVERFGKISDAIWSYAELGMQEFKSSKLLADTLEQAGFKVERGLAGMPTCFVASYGSGKPVIGILGEFDALPMISQKGRSDPESLVEGAPGHGCGHNAQGAAAAAAAIAVKQAIDKFGIQRDDQGVRIPGGRNRDQPPLHGPGRALSGCRCGDRQSRRQQLRDVVRGGRQRLVLGGLHLQGKTAHAAGSPWSARSALDAVDIMNVAVNYLREHLFYTERIHYVITEGGEAPNVVPDRASVWYYVRDSDERLADTYDRVVNCAKAGALASGNRSLSPCASLPRSISGTPTRRPPSFTRKTSNWWVCRHGR